MYAWFVNNRFYAGLKNMIQINDELVIKHRVFTMFLKQLYFVRTANKRYLHSYLQTEQ